MAAKLKAYYHRKRGEALSTYEMYATKAQTTLGMPFRVFKRICFWWGFTNVVISIVLIVFMVGFFSSIPAVDRMSFADMQNLARKRVAEKYLNKKTKHVWTPLSAISRGYLYGIVSSEDATFFEHDGFNFEAMIDSMAENIRERKAAYGASTISQQVVKNIFLTNEKTLMRKAREFLITIAMEKRFTKNEILELYLNLAEFGPDMYGVEAAARNYFGKRPLELNAAEGAFLGLMLPSPKRYYYSIFQNKNLTKVKRKRLERVLRDMLYEEYITENQYKLYVKYNFFGDGKPAGGKRSVASK